MSNCILSFVCPKCHGHRLEEVGSSEIIVSKIAFIWDDAALDYGHPTLEGDYYFEHYRCSSCGFVLDGIEDEQALVEWIKKSAQES